MFRPCSVRPAGRDDGGRGDSSELWEVTALTAPPAAANTTTAAVGVEATVAHHTVVAVRPDAGARAVEVAGSIAAH
jgi:hypothetical protein